MWRVKKDAKICFHSDFTILCRTCADTLDESEDNLKIVHCKIHVVNNTPNNFR